MQCFHCTSFYPILIHRLVVSLHSSSPRSIPLSQLRFASFTVVDNLAHLVLQPLHTTNSDFETHLLMLNHGVYLPQSFRFRLPTRRRANLGTRGKFQASCRLSVASMPLF